MMKNETIVREHIRKSGTIVREHIRTSTREHATKKSKEPVLVDVWGSKSRTAATQFICRIPARQVVAFFDRNQPFYAYLMARTGPHDILQASTVTRPVSPERPAP